MKYYLYYEIKKVIKQGKILQDILIWAHNWIARFFYGYSSDRDNPMQGMRGQEQRRTLRCDHLRGLQGLLQAVAVIGRQLSMSAEQELCGRPCKQKPVPVLSVAKVPTPRHVKRWWVLSTAPTFRHLLSERRIVLVTQWDSRNEKM